MELFGCRFCNQPGMPGCERAEGTQVRMTYDNLFRSMVTTFQVLDVSLSFVNPCSPCLL